MLITFSDHAKNDRLNKRLLELVTIREVVKAIQSAFSDGLEFREYAFVDVKKFNERIYLDKVVTADTPKGDLITCKIIKLDWNQVLVKTVMLRKSTSQSEAYINR